MKQLGEKMNNAQQHTGVVHIVIPSLNRIHFPYPGLHDVVFIVLTYQFNKTLKYINVLKNRRFFKAQKAKLFDVLLWKIYEIRIHLFFRTNSIWSSWNGESSLLSTRTSFSSNFQGEMCFCRQASR